MVGLEIDRTAQRLETAALFYGYMLGACIAGGMRFAFVFAMDSSGPLKIAIDIGSIFMYGLLSWFGVGIMIAKLLL